MKKKFTKKAFRQAIIHNDQTGVWHLTAIKLGKKPTQNDVYELVSEMATSMKQSNKAYNFAFNPMEGSRRHRNGLVEYNTFIQRGGYRQYGVRHYRAEALKMLRRLVDEPLNSHAKVPMFGFTHLYFCSPVYKHSDYNKVKTCCLNGLLAKDVNGNLYDPQAAWCRKVVDLGNKIYEHKLAEAMNAV